MARNTRTGTSPIKALFADLLDDLAPGVQDPAAAVREKIVYTSAVAPKALRGGAGDSMALDLGHFELPIETRPLRGDTSFDLTGASSDDMPMSLDLAAVEALKGLKNAESSPARKAGAAVRRGAGSFGLEV